MALVEFIEHYGRHAFQMRIGKQTSRKYPFGDKSQPRARADCLFKPDLVPDRLADRFSQFPCDSTRRQSRRNPARLEHNHFAAYDSSQRWRHSSRLPRARRSYDHKVRM